MLWSDKFKFETTDSGSRVTSPILHLLRNSSAIGWVQSHTLAPLGEKIYGFLARQKEHEIIQAAEAPRTRRLGSLGTIILSVCCRSSRHHRRSARAATASRSSRLRLFAVAGRCGRDLSPRECRPAHCLALDDPGRSRHWLQPSPRPALAASDPDGCLLSGDSPSIQSSCARILSALASVLESAPSL